LLYYGRPEGYVGSTLTFSSQSLSPGANNETFVVNGIKFRDYNASIEKFLEK